MYDPAIGRWICQDPLQQFHSPYTYAANNPVVVIDPSAMWASALGDAPYYLGWTGTSEKEKEEQELEERKWENRRAADRYFKAKKQSKNLIVWLHDRDDRYFKTSGISGRWSYVYAGSLYLAAEWVSEKYKKGQIKNLVIRTHGPGIAGGDAAINIFDDKSEKRPLRANHFEKRGENKPYYDREIDALETLGKYLSFESSVLMTACASGQNRSLHNHLYNLFEGDSKKRLTLYMNADNSSFTTEHPSYVYPNFDQALSRVSMYGWYTIFRSYPYLEKDEGHWQNVKITSGGKIVPVGKIVQIK